MKIKNLNLIHKNTLNFLFIFFPLTFILGNLFVNIQILLISIIGFFYYKKKLFDFKKNQLIVFIAIFFLIIILTTILENLLNSNNGNILKSFLYLRYFILLLVLRSMVISRELNFNKLFLSCLVFSCFVAGDIIFQHFAKFNILGFESANKYKNSGLFGDERIAGGYIQRFCILGFFAIPLFLNKKNLKSYLIYFILITLCFFGILLSGNRMPTFMFLIFLFLAPLVWGLKKFNYTVIISFFIIVFLSVLISNNQSFKSRYNSFIDGIPSFTEINDELKREYPEFTKYKNSGKAFYQTETFEKNKENIFIISKYSGHTVIFITSIDIFNDSPFLGRGIKSFRYTCLEKKHLPNRMCENHPHNFYLGILNDVGIIGFFFLMVTIACSIFVVLYNLGYKQKKDIKSFKLFFNAILLCLILEFFPFRSHGDFFSTVNSAYIFFLIGILLGLYELKFKKRFKKIF